MTKCLIERLRDDDDLSSRIEAADEIERLKKALSILIAGMRQLATETERMYLTNDQPPEQSE